MTFNSIEAAAFISLTVAIYWRLPQRGRLPLLLATSYLFYATFDPWFLLLLVGITAVALVAGPRIEQGSARSRRLWLTGAVAFNLAVLAAFKYAGFFVESAEELLGQLGFEASAASLQIVVPVGVSFYVFQTIAYFIDVNRERVAAIRDPLLLATFVAFFPQLAAGPIERAERLLPQLSDLPSRLKRSDLSVGVSLILLGLVRKVVIADTVGRAVMQAYAQERTFFGATYEVQHSWILLSAGAAGFAAQLYGDFAGYSAIARGLGKLFGVDLAWNFRQPFRSRSIAELWRRWHITLMAWFRDYVYFPILSSPRVGHVISNRSTRSHVALIVAFVLAGVWHGRVGWIVTSALHGVLVVGEAIWRNRVSRLRPTRDRSPRERGAAIGQTLTVLAFVVLAIPAGAQDLGAAARVIEGIASLQGGLVLWDVVFVVAAGWVLVAVTDAVESRIEQAEDLASRLEESEGSHARAVIIARPVAAGVLVGSSLLGLLVFSGDAAQPFLYFAF